MDRLNRKPLLHDMIKRFALKTTVSALLALNTESLMADSCPAYITGSVLATEVCDFDTVSSVTVENGGTVAGINMENYNPTLPSYISINAGGLVNNATGSGVFIQSSSLSNGISNSGTISSQSIGIDISRSSTIGGGIFNSGIMHSTSGTGILIATSSTVSGGISNSGTIQANGNFVGIAILTAATITAGVTNSGLIEVNDAAAILLRSGSQITGEILNSGTLKSIARTGIAVFNLSNIQHDITNNGTISGGMNGISLHDGSSLSDSIVNNGEISGGQQSGLLIYANTTIGGSISNSGLISGGTTGISILSSAAVNHGISNSGTISGGMYAINIDSSTVNDLDILGQSARIIGDVEARNTRVNITNAAIFTSEGDFDVNNFNIASGAQFNMAGRITASTVTNSGTLAITNSVQTIVGNYNQIAGSIFQTGVSSSSQYGQLSVLGIADLSSSGNIYVQVDPNNSLHAGDVLTDIISGNSLNTPGDGFTVNDNSYIWVFTPQINDAQNGINLIATINPDIHPDANNTNTYACKGSYCQGAARTIIEQIAAGNAVFSPYSALPTARAFQEAASQSTPELTNENNQVTQLITRAVLDVVPMWRALHGQSAGDAMFYQGGKLWAKPYGASMTQNQRNSVQGFNATAYGAVIGKDIPWRNDSIVGVALAAGGDTMRGKSVLDSQTLQSSAYQGMVYGAKKLPQHFYVAGQGLVGFGNNHTQRFIPLYASTAIGSYNSWFTNIRAEAGWSTYALSPNFIFTPELDVSYLFINQASYRESGSLMDLQVASNHNASLILGAYGNGAYHLATIRNQHDLTLTGYAGIAGDVINSQPQTISTFVAGGSSFSTFGVQFNAAVFRGGAGLSVVSPKHPLSFELNYDLQVGNNAYSGVGSATIKYKT